MPVLEALLDPGAVIEKVIVARTARGEAIDRILDLADGRGVRVERADARRVTAVSRNGRHDQGVVADIASPGLAELEPWLEGCPGPLSLLLLDGVTNPSNVGMVIRTATAAGLDGVVLPRRGCPDVGPLVVKASAGVALRSRILRVATATDAAAELRRAGVTLIGLAAVEGEPLWEADIPPRAAFVLGNETSGMSSSVAALVHRSVSIPLTAGGDSLNVASAAAVLAFELARRLRA